MRNKDAGVETRRRIRSPEQTHLALLSTIEPNSFEPNSFSERFLVVKPRGIA
jgi:hypothetical protein